MHKLSLPALVCAGVLAVLPAAAQTPPEVTLTRIDCGTGSNMIARFNDTFAYPADAKLPFTFSCYLIKHGNDYMVWDTGFAPGSNPSAPKTSLVEYLAQLKVTPDMVKYVGISHYHGDHTGQLNSLPRATLLIGKGDWDEVNKVNPITGVNVAGFSHWLTSNGKAEPLTLDKDVFGDGTVIILDTPGHTPGHRSLLVRLKEMGPVILIGDLTHFRENYENNGVPAFNFNRADTLASLDRVKRMAAAIKATVIIQHDPRDIEKLPAFPAAAR